ncbi:MAG TPA: LuxR C-terminal-related transcriptional regulator [Tepidisphaeraceae bacterium]|jgi:DNA-binding NarL/FixJ family response regulator
MNRPKTPASEHLKHVPPLPLTAAHWKAVFGRLDLSPQQAQIVEYLLRGMCDKQIAAVMGISEPTVRTYINRIGARTRTHGRMELAMCVLAISHEVTLESVSSNSRTHRVRPGNDGF